ncbi:MAG TPA: sulfite exporter TauE/SafE family protein, partial [Acidimicrobiales bacterium]
TFPTLIATGASALTANVTATVGVVPSSLGIIRGFRVQLRGHRAIIRSLVPYCLVGTASGCTLLLLGSPKLFQLVVPWLIGAGTLLFAFAPLITKRLAHVDHAHPGRRWTLNVGIFLVAMYGGYFGAGMGILLLAVMAVSLPFEIADLQGLRSVLSLIINLLAALIFVARGHLILDAVYMFLVGTLVGGWLGAILIMRLSPNVVRVLIIAVGVVTTVRLAITA